MTSLTQEQQRKLAEIFNAHDADKNGTLSSTEFCAAIRSACGQNAVQLSSEELAELFELYDDNHDGKLTLLEFYRIVADS